MSETDLLNQTPLSLFQNFSLPQVQQISKNLTTLSNTKHEEIRNLVGSKYRDLLISADEITIMEKLSYEQDAKLYDLIFGKLKIGIDDKISKFVQHNDHDGIRSNKISQDDKILQIQKKVEFSIKLSKFLKINSDDELQDIEIRIKELGEDSQWDKDQSVIILEKFEEIEIIIQGKLNNIDDINELVSLQKFYNSRKEFNHSELESLLYNHLKNLLNFDNLKLILEKFPNFVENLDNDYQEKIKFLIDDVENEINSLNLEGKNELKLYQLEFDDDEYLLKIEYLSKGLIYKEYQDINHGLTQIKFYLNFIKVINSNSFENLNKIYEKVLSKFKSHAEETGNSLLIKYLSLGVHNVSLK